MNLPTKIFLPDYVIRTLFLLEANGYNSWCVGGCVRDALLMRPTHDYDIATSAPWKEVERILGTEGFSVHRTGTKHGTVTVSLNDHAFEITTFRVEGTYSDGRHPNDVSFVSSIEEDLARRDFTINALAYHPERGLLDCYGGLQDLKSKTIRTVGKPTERFTEDGLRILRGCRFASQLGFTIEPATLYAMNAHKMMLTHVSSERITHELSALLLGNYVHDALLNTIDVLVAVLPELAACREFAQCTPYHIFDVWEHTAWVVQYAPATRLARWTALFHDVGKPAARFFENKQKSRAHFYGHAKLSIMLAKPAMQRLNLAPSFIERVLTLIQLHDVTIAATQKSVRHTLANLKGDLELMRTLIGIKRADAMAQSNLSAPRIAIANKLEEILNEIEASKAAYTVKQLAINGHDVIALGIPAGPAVGQALESALQAVIDEYIPNERNALLAFLARR